MLWVDANHVCPLTLSLSLYGEGTSDESSTPYVDVLYLDNHLLVVDKPAGMLSQEDRTGDLDVVTWAKAEIKQRFDKPGNVFIGLVHRLDRPVSGVMVLARTSKAAGRLSDQFRRRAIDKRYLAVVEGSLQGGGEAVDWLVKGKGGTVRRVPPNTDGAKEARLRWRPLADADLRFASTAQHTLVEVELMTGRAHQIRVQLSGMGTPIVGDLRYGASGPLGDGRGIALHAVRLTLDHPTRKEPMTWVSAPPSRWRGLLDAEVARAVADQAAR
ncbi:MAG: RluA family pseudouridine synthase [Rubricoccaceae bacterium]